MGQQKVNAEHFIVAFQMEDASGLEVIGSTLDKRL